MSGQFLCVRIVAKAEAWVDSPQKMLLQFASVSFSGHPVGEWKAQIGGQVTDATKLNAGSMREKHILSPFPSTLYKLNWLPDQDMTSDQNTPLLSEALPVLSQTNLSQL